MSVSVFSVLWDGWQSLVILWNIEVILTIIFLRPCFKLRSTENLRTVPRLRLSASSSVWLKYETSNSNHLKNPTSHLMNPLLWSTSKREMTLSWNQLTKEVQLLCGTGNYTSKKCISSLTTPPTTKKWKNPTLSVDQREISDCERTYINWRVVYDSQTVDQTPS